MKKEMNFALTCLLISAVLVACTPSQTETDSQATKIADSIFATLTAASPASIPTSTPVPAIIPSLTQAPTEITPAALGTCRIVYLDQQDRNIFVRNCDGSGAQRVTDLVTDAYSPEHPVWSPDGQMILFASRHEGNTATNSTGDPCTSLYVIRADGSGLTRWTVGRCDSNPAWSPDGTQIALHRECGLTIINLDGTGTTDIAKPHEDLFCIDQSAWSPDGKQIAFTSLKWPTLGRLAEQDVFVVNADETNLRLLAAIPADNWVEYSVVWSPDGSQIAFSLVQGELVQHYTVNSDGAGKPIRTTGIPEAWYPWYWPQWGNTK